MRFWFLVRIEQEMFYYSKIKPQLTEPSVVDMEVEHSYTIAIRLIEEAEEKPSKRLRKLEKKTGKKKRKQEEQEIKSQTSQQSQSR